MKYTILFILVIVTTMGKATNLEPKLVKDYEKTVFVWILMEDYGKDKELASKVIDCTKTISELYCNGKQKTLHILYMNNPKGIPPKVNSEEHAQSIVNRSLSTSIMALYFYAYTKTEKPTREVVFHPVEKVHSVVKSKLKEDK